MFNLVNVFNKIYVTRFDLSRISFVKVVLCSRENIEKIIKTHSGFSLFTEEYVYKVTYSKNINHLYSNQTNFYTKIDKKYLVDMKCIYLSSDILLTKENKIKDLKDKTIELKDAVKLYRLILKDNIVSERININRFVDDNFSLLEDGIYRQKIEELLSGMNNDVSLGLTHGDFWRENILQTRDLVYLIDYNRSCEYSFIEFDLINYFIFFYVYLDKKPSWSVFIEIIIKLFSHDVLYVQLKFFIGQFYIDNSVENINDKYLDEIIQLYVVKTLYVNNSFLEGLDSLKWYRHRLRIEKLLWS